jgi:hypothetical protein
MDSYRNKLLAYVAACGGLWVIGGDTNIHAHSKQVHVFPTYSTLHFLFCVQGFAVTWSHSGDTEPHEPWRWFPQELEAAKNCQCTGRWQEKCVDVRLLPILYIRLILLFQWCSPRSHIFNLERASAAVLRVCCFFSVRTTSTPIWRSSRVRYSGLLRIRFAFTMARSVLTTLGGSRSLSIAHMKSI